MEPKFVTKPAFQIIGVELKTTVVDGKNFKEIPAFWGKVMGEKLLDKIPNKKNEKECLGVCDDFQCYDNTFSYFIACEVTSTDEIPDGMVARTVPEAKYAVFTVKGKIPEAIHTAVNYIFKDWLPNSEYDHGGTAEVELYDDRCTEDENAEMDIYVPIKEKA